MRRSLFLSVPALAVCAVLAGCSGGDPDGGDLGFLGVPTADEVAALAADIPCAGVTAVEADGAMSGALASGDCTRPDGSSVDYVLFRVTEAATVDVSLESSSFDAYLLLWTVDGSLIEDADDVGDGDSDALIESEGLSPGLYVMGANSYDAGETGAYTLRIRASD